MPWKVVNYLTVAHNFWWGLVKSRELRGLDCRGILQKEPQEKTVYLPRNVLTRADLKKVEHFSLHASIFPKALDPIYTLSHIFSLYLCLV